VVVQESYVIYHRKHIVFIFKAKLSPPCQLAPSTLLYLAVVLHWTNLTLKGRVQKGEVRRLPPTRAIWRGLRRTDFFPLLFLLKSYIFLIRPLKRSNVERLLVWPKKWQHLSVQLNYLIVVLGVSIPMLQSPRVL